MFRPKMKSATDSIKEANDATVWADAFVLGSPDYHGSMSGALKNFLDYHWQEFAGKEATLETDGRSFDEVVTDRSAATA